MLHLRISSERSLCAHIKLLQVMKVVTDLVKHSLARARGELVRFVVVVSGQRVEESGVCLQRWPLAEVSGRH